VGEKKHILIQFGKTIRRARLSRGWSQEKLGTLAKMHRTYIGMIERAEKNITLTNIEKLARALGTKVEDFFQQ